MLKFRAAIFILLLIVFADARSQVELFSVLVGKNGYPPFVIPPADTETSDYSGIFIDFLKQFESSQPGFQYEFVNLPLKRALQEMRQNQLVDVMLHSPLFIGAEITRHYTFSETLFESRDVVISLKKHPVHYREPTDLLGLSVSALRGYTYKQFDSLFAHDFVFAHRVDLHTRAIRMLHMRRVNAYFGNIHVSPYYIRQLGLELDDFLFSENALFEFDLAVLVRNNKRGLLEALNEFARQARADGTLQEIVERYVK